MFDKLIMRFASWRRRRHEDAAWRWEKIHEDAWDRQHPPGPLSEYWRRMRELEEQEMARYIAFWNGDIPVLQHPGIPPGAQVLSNERIRVYTEPKRP